MRVEEQYMDVLQNIEHAILNVYRQHPKMSDYNVLSALEALIDAYTGEKIGRPPRRFNLSDVERKLVDEIHSVCEWRLGRAEPPTGDIYPEPISIDEIILCLKRIDKSVKTWNKEGGMQGYLNFIVDHVF